MKLSEVKQKFSNPPYHENCKCTLNEDGSISTENGVCDYCIEQQDYTKNNKVEMNKQEFKLEDGSTLFLFEDGTKEIVKEEEVKEEELSEVKEEEVKEEVKESFICLGVISCGIVDFLISSNSLGVW